MKPAPRILAAAELREAIAQVNECLHTNPPLYLYGCGCDGDAYFELVDGNSIMLKTGHGDALHAQIELSYEWEEKSAKYVPLITLVGVKKHDESVWVEEPLRDLITRLMQNFAIIAEGEQPPVVWHSW